MKLSNNNRIRATTMDNDTLLEKLNEINISLAEIKKELKFNNTQMEYDRARITKLEKSIYGNGNIGIRTQVFVLWGAFIIIGTLLLRIFK